jgi:hypothetical protein
MCPLRAGQNCQPCLHGCTQLFCNARREGVKAANPGAGYKEMSSLLAAAWKGASEAERAPFASQHQARCQTLPSLACYQRLKAAVPPCLLSKLCHVRMAARLPALTLHIPQGGELQWRDPQRMHASQWLPSDSWCTAHRS